MNRQQIRFDEFRHEYNYDRPHEALDKKTPGSVYERSPRKYPEKLRIAEYEQGSDVRIVRHGGEIGFNLRVELDQHDSLQGHITIRLYEPGPRQRIRKLSKQEIASGVTVVRILMPEGILWDDPSAFSGSMEDSESVTRYNTDSGLVWKEYNRRLWTIPSNTATGSVLRGVGIVLRIELLCAIRTDAVGKDRIGSVADIRFYAAPLSVCIPDLLAGGTDRQGTFQIFHLPEQTPVERNYQDAKHDNQYGLKYGFTPVDRCLFRPQAQIGDVNQFI